MLGFFKKKPDPLADRTRTLNAQIAALESQIKSLETSKPAKGPDRSPPAKPPHEPVFEALSLPAPPIPPSPENDRAHFNDLGARKYDLVGAWRKLKSYIQGPPASNPKLVSYLAAGSIKGLRPLRYEKRVARNRFVGLAIFFVLLLWGLLAVLFNQR